LTACTPPKDLLSERTASTVMARAFA